MTDRVKLDNETERKLNNLVADVARIAADVSDIKHTLAALATSLQIADNVPALVAESKAREAEAKAQAEADQRRHRFIVHTMGLGSGAPAPGPARRTWLEHRLANTDYLPLRDSDDEEFGLV